MTEAEHCSEEVLQELDWRLQQSQKSWIESTFTKRECVYILPVSKDPHRSVAFGVSASLIAPAPVVRRVVGSWREQIYSGIPERNREKSAHAQECALCLPGCQICQQLVRCCCGRLVRQHVGFTASLAMKYSDVKLGEAQPVQEEWSVEKHTEQSPTDAYGIINFQGGSHSYRAKYVRLSHDSRPEAILRLMLKEWQMELPKIVISVHGGIQNFDLHPRIKQVVGKGLIKAAVTTGAWILTGGVNTGKTHTHTHVHSHSVAKHVGDALKEHSSRSARKICTIGIAPWGVIENRNDLIGRDVVAPYQTLLNPLSKLNVLNNLHSHFVLVDDGTVGKYGAEVNLRRELEKHINLQRIHARMPSRSLSLTLAHSRSLSLTLAHSRALSRTLAHSRSLSLTLAHTLKGYTGIGQGVPVVALIFEGGPNVILTVLEYLQESPPVPVVVCEGTGRAADILSYVHKQTEDDGGLPDGVETDIIATIKKTFNLSQNDAVHLFQTLMECMKNKELITVFHVGSEEHQDIDVAILKALLKGTDASAFDQLVLTLAWNRVDIAKDHVFVYGQKLLGVGHKDFKDDGGGDDCGGNVVVMVMMMMVVMVMMMMVVMVMMVVVMVMMMVVVMVMMMVVMVMMVMMMMVVMMVVMVMMMMVVVMVMMMVVMVVMVVMMMVVVTVMMMVVMVMMVMMVMMMMMVMMVVMVMMVMMMVVMVVMMMVVVMVMMMVVMVMMVMMMMVVVMMVVMMMVMMVVMMMVVMMMVVMVVMMMVVVMVMMMVVMVMMVMMMMVVMMMMMMVMMVVMVMMVDSLEQAMLDALVMDRVDFVKLLIENGVSMHRFLTISRLEELYNTKQSPNNPNLFQLVRDVKQGNLPPNYKITLIDVGLVIEYLMGGTYRCNYTRKRFRIIYNNLHGNSRRSGRAPSSGPSLRKNHEAFSIQADKKEKTRHNHFIKTAQPYKPKLESSSDLQQKRSKEDIVDIDDPETRRFPYPFNELLVWAVLMKRQKMSLFFWQHGEESMAKALVACKLCRSMCYEAKKSDMVDDTSEELKEYSNEFGRLAVDLLEQSFRQDETMAMKLLMYELKNWSNSTCLKLAVSSRLRPFVAHTCTQMLLSDMWMGRLNMRKNSWYKVILSILVFPAILALEYKSKAEMAHIPQSQDAHQRTMEDSEHNQQNPDDIQMDVFKESRMNESPDVKNEMEVLIRSRRLPITRKFYDFYHAPIVKFWTNTLFYLGFLMLYSYVVLVKLPSFPSPQEWAVILYIFTSAIEKIREMFMSEGGKISQKIKVWFSDYFNTSDFIAIIMFLVGFGLRFGSGDVFVAGRIVYCLNIIFWYVRLLDILAVNQQAGPYVMMIGKMVANMFYIVVIMVVVLVTYGVPRKAILYPDSEAELSLIVDVVFQPYWMMYGEVYAYEIDVCSNASDDKVRPLCKTGVWLTPALQAVYLFIQYILMVNLLIAFFNNVYLQVMSMSNLVWKYQRYHFTMAYHDKPVLPPPLIIFCHLASLFNFLCKRRKKDSSGYGPKLFLTEEDQKKLHDFEEQCVETYFHEKEDKFHSGSDERIRLTSDRVETMSIQLREVGNRVNFIKRSLHSLDSQIGHLQDLSALTVDTLKALTAQRASEASKVHNEITRELSLSKNLVPGPADSKASVLVQRSVYPPPANMADSLFGGRAEEAMRSRAEFVLSPERSELSALSPERRPLFTPEAGSSSSALPHTHTHARTHSHTQARAPSASRPDDANISSLPSAPATAATFFVSSTPNQPSGAHTLTHTAHTHTPMQTEHPHTPASVEFGAFVGEYDEGDEDDDDDAGDSEQRDVSCVSVSVSVVSEEEEERSCRGASCLYPTVVVVHERECYVNPAFTDDDEGSVGGGGAPAFSPRKPQRAAPRLRRSQPCKAALHRLRIRNGARGHKDEAEGQGSFPTEGSAGCRQLSPPRKVQGESHMRTVNSYAGFTELDRNSAFQHPETSLSKREKSRVSAEDVVFPEDPRAALLLERAQGKSAQASTSLSPAQDPSTGEYRPITVTDSRGAAGASAGLYSGRHTHLGGRKDSIGSPFKPMEGYQYSAVERNNLMRLSQSIPFTPVPPRGEPVTVYRLEESSPNNINNSMSSWTQRGLCAKIEFLSKEEMGGGLRKALKVLCTWSEYDILKPGHLYIVKSFLPDVVNTWQSVYKEDTVLHLCLREIQQQRAAQKLTFAFNQIRPKTIPYSPRFLEVFLLYCHSAGQWFAIEECITGEFRKFNNNNGDEIVPTNLLEETMLAFSHWSYEYTRGELLVLDLQAIEQHQCRVCVLGVLGGSAPPSGGLWFSYSLMVKEFNEFEGVGEILTDPSVIKSGEKGSYDMVFGPANLGDDAIRNFRTKHHCNSCCRKLKLPDLKRNDYTPEKVTLQQDDQTEGSPPSPPAGGSTKEQRHSMRLML
ncbi:hypothetical protein NFI96_025121 [Prochilodus magdalenae]|nr:hypothetical protein NFI96_025121 [Prochilodus magdalenae]